MYHEKTDTTHGEEAIVVTLILYSKLIAFEKAHTYSIFA